MKKNHNLKSYKKPKLNHHKLLSYRELFNLLKVLNEEDLDQTVTIYSEKEDEYFPVLIEIHTVEQTDTLDKDHKVLIIKSPEL